MNRVTIRFWPAIRSVDGSASDSREWKGLLSVFGGDTYPNQWHMEYAKDADVASHGCFLPPEGLAANFAWDQRQAPSVSTRMHTEPAAFGKVMSTLKPRMSVGYHNVQSPETKGAAMDGVHKACGGRLALTLDLLVINVKDDVVVRM